MLQLRYVTKEREESSGDVREGHGFVDLLRDTFSLLLPRKERSSTVKDWYEQGRTKLETSEAAGREQMEGQPESREVILLPVRGAGDGIWIRRQSCLSLGDMGV